MPIPVKFIQLSLLQSILISMQPPLSNQAPNFTVRYFHYELIATEWSSINNSSR